MKSTVSLYSLLCISLGLFLYRGPYRAIQRHVAGDAALIYASANCWISRANPYDHNELEKHFIAAGGPQELVPKRDFRPSVYLLTAMPLVSAVAWLPWALANATWALVSAASFLFLLTVITSKVSMPREHKLLVTAAMLAFSPTISGLVMGNPSVIATNLLALAVYCHFRGRRLLAGLCTGLSLCIKPQLGMFAVCVFIVWKDLLPVVTSVMTFTALGFIGMLRAGSYGTLVVWWQMLLYNIERSVAAGGINDPSSLNPYSFHLVNAQALLWPFVGDGRWTNFVVYGIAAGLLGLYLSRRRHAGSNVKWTDLAFFSVWTLLLTYHRYYDAQLLLFAVPVLLVWLKTGRRFFLTALMSVCLALMALPLQFWAAEYLPTVTPDHVLLQFLPFRHAPLAVLVMAIVVVIGGRPAMPARLENKVWLKKLYTF